MIHVGYSDLARAFRQHGQAARNVASASCHLLMFYGVECGLKSHYLRENCLRTTEQMQDSDIRIGHDLASWAKILHIPASIIGTATRFRLERDSTTWPIASAHQAWRYGARIDAADERALRRWLEAVSEWLQERVQR